MAWLHAAPKRHNKDEKPKSRLSTLDENDPANSLPEICEYYALCFELSGMFSSSGMGATPLTWVELDAFISRSGYHLTGFEAEQIMRMSRDYCSFSHRAKELGCPPPYSEAITDDEDALEKMRAKVARQWEDFGAKLNTKRAK